jgi:hypothetical protein
MDEVSAVNVGRGMSADSMSALSIRQPWAWFIVNGYKDIENRSWKPTAARIGQRFLVHASQRRLTRADFEDFLANVRELRITRYPKSIDDFDYGAIVGSAVIEEVVRGSKSFWAIRGNHHWVLTKAKKSPPKSMKGQLGFFKVRGPR